MNLELADKIRTSIAMTVLALNDERTTEPVRPTLLEHLNYLLVQERLMFTVQAFVSGTLDAPWYPDDSGEWVEVPGDCMTSPVSAGTEVEVLVRRARHGKSRTPLRGAAAGFCWDHNATESGRIVAYKVVKP